MEALQPGMQIIASFHPTVKVALKIYKGEWEDRFLGLGHSVHNYSHLLPVFDELASAPSLRDLAIHQVITSLKQMAVKHMLLLNVKLVRL